MKSPHIPRALYAAPLALLLLAEPAHAIFGSGIVYDPANHANAVLRYGQLILQGQQMARQLTIAARQADHAVRQARGFSIGRLRIPSLGTLLGRIDARYGSGESLGYGNSRLDALFRRTFPEVAEWNHQAAGQQAQAAREAAYNLLLSTRDHHLQIAASQRRLDDLKLELAGAATEREVAQIQNRIAAEHLDQELLGRTLEMGSASMQAVDVALRADQAAREAMRDTAGVLYGAYQQGMHESARSRVTARQDSIADERASRRRAFPRH